MHRMLEQASDYRLNPSLQLNCKTEINKFCSDIVERADPDKELNGQVIKCLRTSFRQSRLTNKCEKEMANILREQALDVRLNPLLKTVCKMELEMICKMDDEDDPENVEECLKSAFLGNHIANKACQIEVANMIEESQADINVDPILQQSCAYDLLTFCGGIPQGNSRRKYCF